MGSTLLPLLAQHGWQMTAPRSNQLDITDETAVARALELAQPEVVLHLAAYTDVAKRNYTPEQIMELIYNPKPENWPEHATPMPPMPQVPREEALKIARWINSLK